MDEGQIAQMATPQGDSSRQVRFWVLVRESISNCEKKNAKRDSSSQPA